MFFITISKITKKIFAKICWQSLKTSTRTWKCTRCIMQMSYLYASDFPFKHFCKIAQRTETIRKKMFGKRVMTLLVVDESTEHDKPYFDFYVFMFFTRISTSKKMFSSWKRHCAAHWRERRGWDLACVSQKTRKPSRRAPETTFGCFSKRTKISGQRKSRHFFP